jgi:large subunit ribosomal protein L16
MLAPKKFKHRKWQRTDRIKGKATSKTYVSFGEYGLKSLQPGFVTSRQIESARRILSRYTQRGGKVWIRIFPDRPITTKGAEMPMGKGKGAVDHYAAVVKPGTVMFEITGIGAKMAKEALIMAAYKLPVKCKVITR